MSKVFISHSSRDKDRLEDFRDLLAKDNVPYWVDDQGILVGDDAPKELRTAIQECACCIFFATRNSLGSQWCLIETAAFWGAGKEVLPYLAEPDVDREMLPEHLKNAHPSRVSKAVREKAAKLVRLSAHGSGGPQLAPSAVIPLVAVEDAIRRAVGLVHIERSLQERLLLVRAMVAVSEDFGGATDAFIAVLQSHLAGLRGFARSEIDAACRAQWPVRFTLEEGNGQQTAGYSVRKSSGEAGPEFTACMVLFFKDDYCDGAAVARIIQITSERLTRVVEAHLNGNAGFNGQMTLVEGFGTMGASGWPQPEGEQ